jgi:hypothetical protein
MLNTTLRPWLLAIAVVPLALTLTGCFGIPGLPSAPGGPDGPADGVDDELVEDIVEDGSGSDVDFESDSLPADFPVDDIPLVPGEVGPSMSVLEGQAWTVTIFTADEATAKSAESLLEQDGFVNDAVFWEKDGYLVLVIATDEGDDGRWYVYYQIQKKQ